jgi:ankyrin repeat protein
LLLEKGANPNAGRAAGLYNPLVCAALAKNVESLRLLIARGGDARRVDESGGDAGPAYGDGSVLHAALVSTNAECCRELLAHGADPCRQGSFFDGGTPMHVVVRCAWDHDDGPERVKILDLLLEAGASLLAVDGRGRTPGQLARRNEGAPKEVREWFVQHDENDDDDSWY